MIHPARYPISCCFTARLLVLTSCLYIAAGCTPSPPMSGYALRMQMAEKRLSGDEVKPVFTDEFILADVNLNPNNPRLFDNFSGDLSGRYIEVMTHSTDSTAPANLALLVQKLITYQHPDGRFGNVKLPFTADQIGGEHMALLWGNGRLLVGLMEYYKRTKNKAVLQSAQRLGDFFAQTYEACSSPAITKKLEGFGAKGIICFTQYVEGLVMLSQYSGNDAYARLAAKTYPVLPARGVQHTHGYLSTLRGVLMLHEYDKNPAHLAFVKKAFDDLVNSTDYTQFGSVREYFGSPTDHGPRDEGCSTADFLRLSLGLHRITHDRTYLDKAEFCLLNALYFNQYFTGDFGAHVLTDDGAVYDYLHSAWWCCTMHGLRAMQDVKENYMVETNVGTAKLNLYLATDYVGKNLSLSIQEGGLVNNRHQYSIDLKRVGSEVETMLVRMPPWAESAAVTLNGNEVATKLVNGYLTLTERPKTGDKLNVGFTYKTVLVTSDQTIIPLTRLGSSLQTGTIHYGPYLMGIDEKTNPGFTAEPNNNFLYAKTITSAAGHDLSVQYTHGGYASLSQARMRPVLEQTFDKHSYLTVRFRFSPSQPDGKPQPAPMPY